MEEGLFANLPSEIIIEILSRLPVVSIRICKSVEKSWLNLLQTPEFVKVYLSTAIPGLAVIDVKSNLNKIIQFEQGPELDQEKLHYSTITNFSLPSNYACIGGSVNGLLFMCNMPGRPFVVCVCNPITREYIELDCASECGYTYGDANVIYGFGATKKSGKHKVVLIDSSVCHVFTLETSLWRRIPYVSHLKDQTIAVFLNGKLHWLVFDRKQISCFDLETERFSAFWSPSSTDYVALSALEGCLCLCDPHNVDGITLWLMKEYGDEKSWTKQFLVCYNHECPAMYPIKVFEDGDILMVLGHMQLLHYSNEKKILNHIESEPHPHIDAISHTPSFLSLKSFGLENVGSF